MAKNKSIVWSNISLFCFVICLALNIKTTVAQQVDDWAAPLQKAQTLQQQNKLEQALAEFIVHAQTGNGLAQFNVALFYDLGWGIPEQRDVACLWYQKAANNNMPGAMQQLGQCFENGDGVEKNQQQALSWYTKAYEQGVYGALCQAGEILINGNGIKKNKEKGIQLCALGAQQGAVQAQANLAKWYFYGTHLPQDYQQAFNWLTQVASVKSPESAYLLALYYDQGIGMDIDVKIALKWYEVAASQGYQNAYLPTAALYWQAFTEQNKETLLAKTYLWSHAACKVNTLNQEANKRLKNQVLEVMPSSWQSELNQQVNTHLSKFSSPIPNSEC